MPTMIIRRYARQVGVNLTYSIVAATSFTFPKTSHAAQSPPTTKATQNQSKSMLASSELPDLDIAGVSEPAARFLAQNDPDKDNANIGKPRVFTQTTLLSTLQHRMVDSIDDYSRRVDASVNFNATNGSINMRGLDRNRVLTTIDGIRVTWTNDGSRGVEGGVAGFNFDAISSIDVVKNANSSFFGTGALGGVVAINTLNPEDIIKPGRSFAGLNRTTFDSLSRSVYTDQSLAARYGRTLILLHGSFRRGQETPTMGHVGGPGVTRSLANPETYSQGGFLGKIHEYFGDGHRLEIVGEHFKRDDNIDALTSVTPTYTAYQNEQLLMRDRFSARYDFQAASPVSLISEAHLTGYWQNVDQQDLVAANRRAAPMGLFDRHNIIGLQSYGSVGSVTANLHTGPLHHAMTLGEEVYLTDTAQYSGGQDNCTIAIFACRMLHKNQSDMPNVSGTDFGIILQDKIGLGRREWLHVTPGLRLDHYRRTPNSTSSYKTSGTYRGLPTASSGRHASPKFLAEARIAHRTTLYAQYAEAFRAPAANELYLNYGNPGTYLIEGNPDLIPETSRGYEIGLKYGDSERGINLDFYDNFYRNFIDNIALTSTTETRRFYPMGIQQEMNRKQVRIYGAEITAQWRFKSYWKVWTSLSYANGRDTHENVHLNSVAPFRGITGVSYDRKNWGGMLSSTYAGTRNKVQNPSSDLNKVPGYVLFDFTGWYSPTILPNLRIQAGLYNIFNKRYWNAVSLPDNSSQAKAYYTQPGRSFKVTGIISF